MTEAKIPKFKEWPYCRDQAGVNNCWQLPFSKKSEFCEALKSGEIDTTSAAAGIKNEACVWCGARDVEQICDVLDIGAAALPGPTGQEMEQSKKCGKELAKALEENARGMSSDVLQCQSLPEFFAVARGTARETFKTNVNKRTGKPYPNRYLSCNANAHNYFSVLCDTYFPTCLTDNPKAGRPTFNIDSAENPLSCATAQFDPSAKPIVKPERPRGLHVHKCADVLKTSIEATADKSQIMNMCSSSRSYMNWFVSTKALTEDGPKLFKEPEQKTCYKSYDNYISTVCWSYMKVCDKYHTGRWHNDHFGNRKPIIKVALEIEGKVKVWDCEDLGMHGKVKFDDFLD